MNKSSHELIDEVKDAIGQVIVGYEKSIELLLSALFSDGHVLIEDVPGVGKTMLARTLATVLGLEFNRIQFTPDLLPSDITGTNVFDPQKGEFQFQPGPVFSNLLLADEINRATPRTQSALLECMQERQVTVGGKTRQLDHPFIAIATQNPVEMSGTFPLPSAQMDRFLLRIYLGYPSKSDEMRVVDRYPRMKSPEEMTQPVLTKEQVQQICDSTEDIYISEDIKEYVVLLVRATRARPEVELGASPRSAIMLASVSRSLAFLRGRDFVTPDDVQDLTIPVLGHRLVASEDTWLRGREGESVLREVIKEIPVPDEEL